MLKASDTLRTLPQGYAAGVEAAAKVMDGYADRCEQRQASCKTDEGREEFKTQAQARRAMAAAIRSLSSADAVVEGWRVTLSDAQRMVLGEAAWDDVQQADLFKMHATEDEKWRRTRLAMGINPAQPLAWIEWEDSAQAVSQWQWIEGKEWPRSIRCVSVGFVVSKSRHEINLAISLGGSTNGDFDQASGVITIPTRAIIRNVRLTPPAVRGK